MSPEPPPPPTTKHVPCAALVTTIAGTGTIGKTDGPALSSQLGSLNSMITHDPARNLL
jgi:hypothetical protein